MSPVLTLQTFQEGAAIAISVGIVPTIPVYVDDKHAYDTPEEYYKPVITIPLLDQLLNLPNFSSGLLRHSYFSRQLI